MADVIVTSGPAFDRIIAEAGAAFMGWGSVAYVRQAIADASADMVAEGCPNG